MDTVAEIEQCALLKASLQQRIAKISDKAELNQSRLQVCAQACGCMPHRLPGVYSHQLSCSLHQPFVSSACKPALLGSTCNGAPLSNTALLALDAGSQQATIEGAHHGRCGGGAAAAAGARRNVC